MQITRHLVDPRHSVALQDTPVAPGGLGRLDEGIPCTRCGCPLFGLLSSQGCPECGEPVETSLRHDRLIFANVEWLKTLQTGIRFILVAQFISIVALFGAPFLMEAAQPIVFFLPFGSLWVGVWKLTTAEPYRGVRASLVTARSMARITLLLPLAILIIVTSPSIAGSATGLMMSLALVLTVVHLRCLAGRMDSPILVRSTGVLALLAASYVPVLAAVTLAGSPLGMITGASAYVPAILFFIRPERRGEVIPLLLVAICIFAASFWLAEKYRQQMNRVVSFAERREIPKRDVADADGSERSAVDT